MNHMNLSSKAATKGKKARNELVDTAVERDTPFEVNSTDEVLDEGNPNFDSEVRNRPEHSNIQAEEHEGGDEDIAPFIAKPLMRLSDFKVAITAIMEEYFVSADVDEVIRSVAELSASFLHYELVKRAVSMSLDRNDRERELVSKLLSAGYPELLFAGHISKGFERLLEAADDLAIDAPQAKTMIATFIARAVIDEVLPPAFLSNPKVASLGGEVIEHAKRMLSRDHSGAKLERIWGPGDGRPVEDLKVAIDQLLAEYLYARQVDEAARCVRELQAPHFHHELVKRAVVMGLDKSPEDRMAISSLLSYLVANDALSQEQFQKGMERLHALVSDLVLDTPNAPALLAEFSARAVKDGCLDANFRRSCYAGEAKQESALNGNPEAQAQTVNA